MGTKLKNIKYSGLMKGIAVFLVWICFMSAVAGAIFLLYNQEIVTTESYYETHKFVEEYSRLVHNTAEYNVKFRTQNGVIIFGEDLNTIGNNSERYQYIKERLAGTVNFAYYIRNTETGDIASSADKLLSVDLLKKQPTYVYFGKGEADTKVYFNQKKSYYTQLNYTDDISRMLAGTSYEVNAALIEPLKPGDVFYNGYIQYTEIKSITPLIIAAAIASVLLVLVSFAYLVWAAGYRKGKEDIVLRPIDRIYTDVHTLLVIFAALLSLILVRSTYSGNKIILITIMGIVLSIDVFIGLSYILSLVRQFKAKQLLRNSLIYKVFDLIRRYMVLAFSGKLFKAWTLIVLLGYGAVNGILFTMFFSVLRRGSLFEFMFAGLLLFAFNMYAMYFAAKSLWDLSKIMIAAKELSGGNLDYSMDTKGMSAAFTGFAEDLHGLQNGLKKAVAEAVKGERMKSELVTNVSHDLKTPLTSIISYVDLLKQEELANDTAKEYVAILEEKSARLKQLIEDLIEASKASSGNLSLNSEKVDLYQLVMQAYGEYEEKIEKAGLDIRTSVGDKEVYVNADGKHMWRIVENLLANALKYSLRGSRVYVNIDKNMQYGVLTIKNISAFPLEVSPEQLTERFVRGDASRTTEGSGLGLSIAQSLTQLQGGSFRIEIDGDLFKAVVEIPLWVE